ncbi:MAG TPA: His/Gly/Thr/Pro-type tRNA ligase C-terminal domain-containing protein, partial [Spirochaetota bacterium]|nr:His/Gly/Thr/Pro-type tRNA ligase C-terminal domain-containing protein [Spirochaetota bacterium]
KSFLGAAELEQADDKTVESVTGSAVGFAGPVNCDAKRIVFDYGVAQVQGAITGANKTDYHFAGVRPGRDFVISEEADIVEAIDGDLCPECGKPMITRKGIEVGHIFKLGKKYTESMKVNVLDNNGKAVVPLMGCYGIGVTRTLAAVIEQHHDEKGLIWPKAVAPFDVHLVGIGKSDDEKTAIDEVYTTLLSDGLEVLYDDRKLSPGVKFADADLLGLPVRITCGKSYFQDGELEIKIRKTGEQLTVKPDDLLKKVREIFAGLD